MSISARQDNINLGVDDEIESAVPVSYAYTVVGLGAVQSNFYNFKTKPVSPHEFDTSMCYSKSENLNIRITFPYKSS